MSGSLPTITINARSTAQQSSSTLSTRKIGERQFLFVEGTYASKGVPDFVNKMDVCLLLSLYSGDRGMERYIVMNKQWMHILVIHI